MESFTHLSSMVILKEREDKFNKFVQNIENIKLKEVWITYDVRPGRGGEKWLNLILQKN